MTAADFRALAGAYAVAGLERGESDRHLDE